MKQSFKLLVATSLTAFVLNACTPTLPTTAGVTGSAAVTAAIPNLVVKAHDYRFELPETISAGLVRVTLSAHGKEPHHVQFARLNDGVTFEQFVAELQKGPEGTAMTLITFPGGAGAVDPGMDASVIIDFAPGNYVLLCLVPSPDGVPHIAKGMVTPLTVLESKQQYAEPEAQATVKLLDFSFALPSEIKAGKQLWQVVNEGTQPHEINFMKLAEGKTMDDIMAWMHNPTGAPPFSNVGGYNGIDPQKVGWMELDLTPGQYVAICHIPDPASGKPHDALGMVLPFAVK